MNIVQNQRASYLNQAQNAARNLTHTLRNLSPAQQAALLATIAAAAGTPIDIVMRGDHGDWSEAHSTIAGRLKLNDYGQWHIGSGCHLHIEEMPR